MEPQLNENVTRRRRTVIIANSTRDKFLSVTFTRLRWTDNFDFASCFDNLDEAVAFTDQLAVREIIGDMSLEYIWNDTRRPVYEH